MDAWANYATTTYIGIFKKGAADEMNNADDSMFLNGVGLIEKTLE